jgi:hypothetical protein
MQRLVSLQHADGSWDLTPELAGVIGLALADVEKILERIAPASAAARQAWATALAVAWLEGNADDRAGEWRLLAIKARRWLERTSARTADGRSWLTAARAELALHFS